VFDHVLGDLAGFLFGTSRSQDDSLVSHIKSAVRFQPNTFGGLTERLAFRAIQ